MPPPTRVATDDRKEEESSDEMCDVCLEHIGTRKAVDNCYVVLCGTCERTMVPCSSCNKAVHYNYIGVLVHVGSGLEWCGGS
jgi:hypothetical protein